MLLFVIAMVRKELLSLIELNSVKCFQLIRERIYYKENGVYPDLVKIDVEGPEFKVLIGMRQLLTNYKPKLLIEIHVKKRMDHYREIIGFLT